MKINKWFVLRFTWLSWAWKTTISNFLFNKLQSQWLKNIEQLDWDEVREHITKDLWFSKKDRFENIKRISYIAKLLSRNDIWIFASFVSPYLKMREQVKNEVTNFIEVFVDTPLEICEQRDIKGLYKKARAWEIKNFTGVSDPFEIPQNPHIAIQTNNNSIENSSNKIYEYLLENNFITL